METKIQSHHLIKNYHQLATSVLRKQALLVAEAGYGAVNTTRVVRGHVELGRAGKRLEINGKKIELKDFDRIFVLAFGKAGLEAATALSEILKDKVSSGYVIDLQTGDLPHRFVSRAGTHPHPSAANVAYTKEMVAGVENLTARDLVLCVASGGGSSLLAWPYDLSPEEVSSVFEVLTRQGADITEINTVRKHLDRVKGGNLAKLLYPATVHTLIFSDVSKHDLSMVASGPTVKDATTIRDASAILQKYKVLDHVNLPRLKLYETPKEEKYFARVHNHLLVSGKTVLRAMSQRAEDLGFDIRVFSDHFEGEAKTLGLEIAQQVSSGQCVLGAGESTVKVAGVGLGGRNQEMALAALPHLPAGAVMLCLASDGHDNTDAAGAIVDESTSRKAQSLNLDSLLYLDSNDSYHFFQGVGDLVFTGLTGANTADFFICLRI